MHNYIITLATFLPYIAFGANAPTDFKSFVALITNLIGILVILVFALTFLAFIWGIVKNWIIHGGSAEGVESGKKVVIVGIITLCIMVSIWGILNILKSSIFGN